MPVDPANPQSHLLAATGTVTDPHGEVLSRSRGPLDLLWLFPVPKELARQARERLADRAFKVTEDLVWSWFVVDSDADWRALEQLEQKAWRRALKTWQGDDPISVHNRATLHRLLYLSPETGERGPHLRQSCRLYHRLSRAQPQCDVLSRIASWSEARLEAELTRAHQAFDDEPMAKTLGVFAEVRGMSATETLQEKFLLPEIDDLAMMSATLLQELLPYQGVVQAPVPQLLNNCQHRVENEILPLSSRLLFRLVPGSRQRNHIKGLVAEVCGVLSQSFFKSQDGQAGQKWQREAERWEPEVAVTWEPTKVVDAGDEQAPRVDFPRKEAQRMRPPRNFGWHWLGLKSWPVRYAAHEAREEWLEAIRFLWVPIFPLRRFICYRNIDTDEISTRMEAPLKTRDYAMHAFIVVLVSFSGLFLLSQVSPGLLTKSRPATKSATDMAARRLQLDSSLQRLKELARQEAELRRLSSSPDHEKLEAIRKEREKLFELVTTLEKESRP